MSRCQCRRCRFLLNPIEAGDAHEVAVVLYLSAGSARVVASAFAADDSGRQELIEAIERWESYEESE